MIRLFSVVLITILLSACSSETNYAPVMDIGTIERVPKNGLYRVGPGETLYSIAWRYGLDYRYVATLNHISPPYHVVSGQRILLNRQAKQLPHKVISPVAQPTPYFIERESNQPVKMWRWPARGRVVGTYSSLNKGINISAAKGSPIYATAAGQVVYSGNGLRGYGNLIIIKHNTHYLTAYAHNSVVLVKEGQKVRAGQEIAEMGSMLHFEIRRNGQPVNPLSFLN